MSAQASHAQDPAARLDADQGGNDEEEGSDAEEDHDCLMPLEADAEREEVEQAVCVDLGKLLAEELASVGDMAGGGDSPPEQPSQAGHVKDDPSGNWSEHLTLEYKGAGASRVCLGYALPSGVRAIKGEGDRRRHHSGKYDFCYGTEVETGIKGRKYATSTVDNPAGNLLPKERKSSLDMDKLRKLGFDPKKHTQLNSNAGWNAGVTVGPHCFPRPLSRGREARGSKHA